jgi:hypothetical protein
VARANANLEYIRGGIVPKQNTWGGKREGSGPKRKKKTVSEKVRANYLKAARKLAKEHGSPIEEAVLGLVYDKKVQDSVKVAILKAYNEALLVKESEQNVNINKNAGPKIGLPEMKPDPAKLIPLKGGKK